MSQWSSSLDNSMSFYSQTDEAVGVGALNNSSTLRPTPVDDRTPPLPTLESSSSLSRRSSTTYGPIGSISNFYESNLFQPLPNERMKQTVDDLLKEQETR